MSTDTPRDWVLTTVWADAEFKTEGPMPKAQADELAGARFGEAEAVTVMVAPLQPVEGAPERYAIDDGDFNLIVSALSACAADTKGRDPGMTKADHTALFMGAAYRLQAQIGGPAGESARARLRVAEAQAEVPR